MTWEIVAVIGLSMIFSVVFIFIGASLGYSIAKHESGETIDIENL